MEALVEGVELLKEVPWSTKPVEEQHGAMGCAFKLHTDLSKEKLALRSYLRVCAIVATPPEQDRGVKRRLRQLDALAAKKPRKARAAGCFLGDVVAEIQSALGPSHKLGKVGMQDVMKRSHGDICGHDPCAQA